MIKRLTDRQRRLGIHKPESGTTLIEVLISLLVLASGVIAMTGVLSLALKGNQSAYYRTQATMLSTDIAERMRVNLVAVDSGGYNNVTGATTASCFTLTGCTSTQLAAQDINDWSAQIAALLPGGVGVVCLDSGADDGTATAFACSNTGTIYAIKIWWDDDRDGTAEYRYVATFQPI